MKQQSTFGMEPLSSDGLLYSQNSQSTSNMKFKKQSQISNKDNFDKILEHKARISINTKTGKHDFTYGNKNSALKDL